MAGGRFLTTCTPKYGAAHKVIAPFGTTLDCVMRRGAFGARQMAQSNAYTDKSIDALFSKINSQSAQNGHAKHPKSTLGEDLSVALCS